MTDPRDARATGVGGPRPEVLDSPVDAESAVHAPGRGRRRAPATRRRFQALSLRARLVLITVGLLVPALALSSAIFVSFLHSILLGDVDDRLTHSAQPVVQSLLVGEFGRGGPPTEYVVRPVWANGAASKTLRLPGSNDLPAADPDFSWLSSPEVQHRLGKPFTVGSTSGDARWRVVSFDMLDRDTGQLLGVAYVATPQTGVDNTIRQVSLFLILVTVGVGTAGGVLGWLAIRRSFRPLIEMEETAAAIAAGDLSRRIPERPESTEVGRLTSSLNGMLTQIESAFRAREASEARTRRFAADASHELRTPLVSIRGFAELFRQGAVPPTEVPRTMRRIEDEAKRMGSLVEDLLLLARLDEQRPGRHEPVDLAVLAGDAVHDARGLDARRAVTLAGLGPRGPEPAVVTGDEDRLRQVVANLVANAVRHTPEGTPIEVAVGRDGGAAVLEVRDHGRGLSPEQAQRVFERFYRVDSSRRRDTGGGSGLGLSIVAAVVASHAGQVGVIPTPGGGATFRIVLPARPDVASGGRDAADPVPGPSAGDTQGGQLTQSTSASAVTPR